MILQNLLVVVKVQSLIEKTQTLIKKKKKKVLTISSGKGVTEGSKGECDGEAY